MLRLRVSHGSQHDLETANWKSLPVTKKGNKLKPKNPIHAILDELALRQQRGETSLIVRLEPDVIQGAIHALRGHRKLFAPVVPGLTDTVPIYAAYEQMRQADVTKHTILLLVECETLEQFREAIGRLPVRKSSEWRSFSTTESAGLNWLSCTATGSSDVSLETALQEPVQDRSKAVSRPGAPA